MGIMAGMVTTEITDMASWSSKEAKLLLIGLFVGTVGLTLLTAVYLASRYGDVSKEIIQAGRLIVIHPLAIVVAVLAEWITWQVASVIMGLIAFVLLDAWVSKRWHG